jgi:aminopeptidase
MTTFDPQLLDKYAELTIRVGVNLKKGQRLALGATVHGMTGVPVQLVPLVRALTKHAYLAGARYVNVLWEDKELDRIRLEYGPHDALDEFPDWRVDASVAYMDAGDAVLMIYAHDPNLMVGQDPKALEKLNSVAAAKMAPALARLSQGITNWSFISGSIAEWATKVFPGSTPEAAEARLWDVIFEICRVKTDDPVASWQQHIIDLEARADYLNAKTYQTLVYRAPGPDLQVGLPDGHLWLSGGLIARNGIKTVANIPTEEVFTMPHKERIDGRVTATKPLGHGGSMIEDFTLTFENGRVTRATAGQGESALKAMLDADAGSRSLGEAALVPHSSPVSQSKLLFYNILYDENASNHLALGNAYKFSMQNGSEMSDEQFSAAGGNQSLIHIDFMIGSAEMDVDGLTEDGASEPIMRGGEWAFEV